MLFILYGSINDTTLLSTSNNLSFSSYEKIMKKVVTYYFIKPLSLFSLLSLPSLWLNLHTLFTLLTLSNVGSVDICKWILEW